MQPLAPQFAVYFGSVRLHNGMIETYSASEVADFYGVGDEDYLAVDMAAPLPFENGPDYMSYIHLKPLADGRYYNAIERFNTENEIQYKRDFDARRGGKWEVPPLREEQI